METYDEWYYTMLLDLLKQKEETNNTHYKQIELEIPLEENYKPEVRPSDNSEVERGVIIIDL